jgi:hypothetical protein
MVAPPAGAKSLDRCLSYGVDANGLYIFFGLRFDDGSEQNITANHLGLGNLINYLTAIATEAQHRRVQVDPTTAHTEVRETQANPVRQIHFEVDSTGDTALAVCTTQSGLPCEVQIPLDILEGALRNLPGLIAEMNVRKAAHRQQH